MDYLYPKNLLFAAFKEIIDNQGLYFPGLKAVEIENTVYIEINRLKVIHND